MYNTEDTLEKLDNPLKDLNTVPRNTTPKYIPNRDENKYPNRCCC